MTMFPHQNYRRFFCTLAAFVLLAFMLPTASVAHSLYIQSGRHQVSEGKASPLFFCYGHHFPVDDAIRRQKLAYVRVIAPDGVANEVALRDDRSLHSYPITYEIPGTYVLTAETRPGYFAMYIDKKGRKRHSLKPMDTFADKAQEILSSMRSSQWAKSYVLCGASPKPFPARVGLPLELVPTRDLSQLKKGDRIELQVYNDGQPYDGKGFWDATYTGFSTEAEDLYIQKTPCDAGQFSVPIDVSGRWFIRFYTKTPAPEERQKEYLTEKRTATLVFEVRNERRRPALDSH
jgi:uncharacterized GH25 family protein